MKGLDEFVAHSMGDHDSTFDSCINLIVHGYSQLEKNEKYSRKSILRVASNVRGRKAKRVELEDYLRNDLITNYINPNRAIFGLEWYQFHSGVEEFEKNIKTGILDIKVCSPKLDGTVYYVFECKRMNKLIEDNYVTEGIIRFIENQYYPESTSSVAGMISFLEAEIPTNKIDCSTSFNNFDTLLKKHKSILQTKTQLKIHKLSCESSNYVDGFKFVYFSSHGRKMGKSDINIYHIILDYNHLIVQ